MDVDGQQQQVQQQQQQFNGQEPPIAPADTLDGAINNINAQQGAGGRQ
jgi:hypothetical protein